MPLQLFFEAVLETLVQIPPAVSSRLCRLPIHGLLRVDPLVAPSQLPESSTWDLFLSAGSRRAAYFETFTKPSADFEPAQEARVALAYFPATMKAAPLLIAWHNESQPIYSAHFDPNGKGRLATAGG